MGDPKMIRWEPAVYVPGVGVIKLTIEQVREICAKRAAQRDMAEGGR